MAKTREQKNSATSRALKDVARKRTCPKCGRGQALRKIKPDPYLTVWKCRYCDYERAHELWSE